MIEVEITNSAIEKMKLFAAMGVPEVWRHNGEVLTMHRLSQSSYTQIQESVALPGFTCSMADQLLAQRYTVGETALISALRLELSSQR